MTMNETNVFSVLAELVYTSGSSFSSARSTSPVTDDDRKLATISLNHSTPVMITVASLLSLLVVATAFGNSLVGVALFRYRSLRSVSNYLIGNLALSDFLLATTVLPLSSVNECLGYWVFGGPLCHAWLVIDVLCCTASIWNICAIAFDRFTATLYPVWYRERRSPGQAAIYITLVWVVALAVCIPPLFGWHDHKQSYIYDGRTNVFHCVLYRTPSYVLFSATGSFYLPFLVTLFLYARIFIALRSRKRPVIIKFRPDEYSCGGNGGAGAGCANPEFVGGRRETVGSIGGRSRSSFRDKCDGGRPTSARDNSNYSLILDGHSRMSVCELAPTTNKRKPSERSSVSSTPRSLPGDRAIDEQKNQERSHDTQKMRGRFLRFFQRRTKNPSGHGIDLVERIIPDNNDQDLGKVTEGQAVQDRPQVYPDSVLIPNRMVNRHQEIVSQSESITVLSASAVSQLDEFSLVNTIQRQPQELSSEVNDCNFDGKPNYKKKSTTVPREIQILTNFVEEFDPESQLCSEEGVKQVDDADIAFQSQSSRSSDIHETSTSPETLDSRLSREVYQQGHATSSMVESKSFVVTSAASETTTPDGTRPVFLSLHVDAILPPTSLSAPNRLNGNRASITSVTFLQATTQRHGSDSSTLKDDVFVGDVTTPTSSCGCGGPHHPHSNPAVPVDSRRAEVQPLRRPSRRRLSMRLRYEQREVRATVRMAIIMAFFSGMWIGFFVIYVLRGCCSAGDCIVPRRLEAFFFWLGYSNSSVNPILYTIFNVDFRQAFVKVLRCATRAGAAAGSAARRRISSFESTTAADIERRKRSSVDGCPLTGVPSEGAAGAYSRRTRSLVDGTGFLHDSGAAGRRLTTSLYDGVTTTRAAARCRLSSVVDGEPTDN